MHTHTAHSFCGYVGVQQIITTLLPDIGALSLAILYSTFAVACIVAPAIVRATGLKPAIAFQLLMLAVWVATNIWPSVELTVPVTLALGVGAGAFWTVRCDAMQCDVTSTHRHTHPLDPHALHITHF
jgi:hypothetical protein